MLNTEWACCPPDPESIVNGLDLPVAHAVQHGRGSRSGRLVNLTLTLLSGLVYRLNVKNDI